VSHELESWTRIGATLWAQSGVVLLLGLLAAKMLRHRGPVAQMMVLRAALTGVAVVAVLSLVAAGRVRTAWRVQLPQFSPSQTVALADASSVDSVNQNAPTMQMNDANAPNLDEAASPAISSNDALTDAESSTRFSAPTSPEAVTSNIAQVATTPHAQRFGVYQLLAIIWACGALMLLSWLLFCSVRIALLRRQSAVVTSGLWRQTLGELCANGKSRQPVLLQSAQVRSPFLVGLWHPAIVLPADELISDESSVRAVLLHELTHWRRRDLWWNLVARIIGTVLWPQPLLWIVGRETERVAEEVCDLAVVQGGCEAKDYARCLLDLSERLTLRPVERTVAAGVVPRQSALAGRVKRILDVSRRQEMKISRRVRVVAAVLTLGAIGLSVSLVSVEAKNENAPEQSSTRSVNVSSPEGVVRAFASALNAKDLDEAARYVEGGAPLINREMQAEIAAAKFSVAVRDFKTRISGTTATVICREVMTAPKNSNGDLGTVIRRTTLSLRQSNGTWKMVSSLPARPERNPSILQGATEILSPRFKSKITAWAKNRGHASIVGRMLDDNGRPVAGARIHVTMISQDIIRQFKNLYDIFQIESLNIAPQVRALFNQYVQTRQDGTFRVYGLTSALYDLSPSPIPERRIPRLIPTGSLHIAAREGSSTRSPNLKMLTGVPVSVRVVESATRKPLAGVELALNAIRNKKQVFWTSGKTDANGRVSLVSLRGRSHVMLKFDYVKRLNGLYVVSNGVSYLPLPKAGDKVPRPINNTYAEGQSVLVSLDKPNEVVFKLQRYVPPKTVSSTRSPWNATSFEAGGTRTVDIYGRVAYQDGRPAVGVRVSLQPWDRVMSSKRFSIWDKPRGNALMRLLKQTGFDLRTPEGRRQLLDLSRQFGGSDITDATGRYHLRGLENAIFNVMVDTSDATMFDARPPMPDYVAAAISVHTNTPPTQELIPDIVFTRGAIIRGRVLDRTTRQPLPRVFVSCHGPQHPRSGAAVTTSLTDAQGRYAMRVAPGTSYVYIGGVNYQLKAMVHFEDSTPYVKTLDVFKSGPDLYHIDSWLQVQQDNAAPRWMRAGPASNLVEVPTTLGQTRTLDFLLNKLVVKQNGSVPDVYIAGKPS